VTDSLGLRRFGQQHVPPAIRDPVLPIFPVVLRASPRRPGLSLAPRLSPLSTVCLWDGAPPAGSPQSVLTLLCFDVNTGRMLTGPKCSLHAAMDACTQAGVDSVALPLDPSSSNSLSDLAETAAAAALAPYHVPGVMAAAFAAVRAAVWSAADA